MNQLRQVDHPEPHRARTRALLRRHPEIRALFGPSRWTAPLTVALVVAQLGLAVLASALPLWAAPILAFAVGAFLAQALYAVLHECSHGLAAPGRGANHAVGLLANLPLLVPMAESYAHYHRMHHRHQGDPRRDPDLPAPAEHRLARGGPLGKLLWHASFPLWQLLRTTRMPRGPKRTPWLVGNVAAQLGAVALIALALGPSALVYLALSLYFTMALHPISARLFQEHHVVHGDQETYSYYGPLSALSLHVGHHNEHHDFPAVAWHRLPALRRIGSSVYDGALVSHRSWTRLWLRFFVDPALGPLARIVRSGRLGSRARSESAAQQSPSHDSEMG